jgi:EAL domain-containing protein (putative c-di-GMP-specific phosphodiesterase class I)
VASFPDDAGDVAELVRRADVAMYTAKHRDRGVERYDPMADPFDRDRLALAGELEDAIERGELTLCHQPVIDVANGMVIGTEALVRWQHPRLGLVAPGAFIELAEVSGLIRPLTRWVVRQALTDLAALERQAVAGLPQGAKVSVNLSVRNLYEHDLLDWFRATLAEFAVEPGRLVVEITESMIMDDQDTAIEVLAGLRALGVRIWIDDFGTGHSSFSRLRELPVDGVKIDRSFVVGAGLVESDRIVLRSIIELVGSLGLTSIAEGVEDAASYALLRALGCDRAQGFHFARPVPFADLVDLIGAMHHPTGG